MEKDLEALQSGQEIHRPQEQKERTQNTNIRRITTQLDLNVITLYEFVEMASNHFEPALFEAFEEQESDEEDPENDRSEDGSDGDSDGGDGRGGGRGRRGRQQGRQRGRGNRRGAYHRVRYNNVGAGRFRRRRAGPVGGNGAN